MWGFYYYYYWGIITVQCSVSFCCTMKWISCVYIPLPSWTCLPPLFSYCSWGSQGRNTEVVCHSLLQWTTFCQTSPPWPNRPEWPLMAWLSFIELDKAVFCVIRLASFLWLWFQCVCPLMSSCNTDHLTWVSLTLDIGYLFTAAPGKHSCCSLPWMRVSPHGHPSWPWMWSISFWPSCAHAAATPWTYGFSSQLPPLNLGCVELL